MTDLIEISANDIIKEAKIENPDYCDEKYIVYISQNDSINKVHINTNYTMHKSRVNLCIHYDRSLCNSLEEYNTLSLEYIEHQAYFSWMDGAR